MHLRSARCAPGTGAVRPASGTPLPLRLPLPTQLVSTVLPLRHRPDGTYRTVLELNPPELGRVQVEIRLHHGALSLHLRAEDDGTGALLRASAGELRAQLEAGGVRTGTLVVDLGGESLAGPFDRHDRERSGPDRGPTAPATQPPPEAAVAPRSPAPDTLVDVLL
ncbi:MAG: flagellar hook-length control protein FliK [Acidimicrobiia bacterium]|nr:flagellar hook-length control protein FliK [Acidimicrobiia bacterium]